MMLLTPTPKIPIEERLQANFLQPNAYHAHIMSIQLWFQGAQFAR